ncbi:MAG: acetate--CoA ligase [Deltaproteobacteria bacterium]|nr:MAG: acetate--CoA ligase [Deltaproteobacteria bacterium]
MAETLIPVPEKFAKSARIGDMQKYRALYDRSLSDPDRFWAEQAERLHWFKKWDKVSRWDFKTAKIEWFMGGKLNASYNCLDRHLSGPRKNKAAIIWEGDSPDESRTLTYEQLHQEVCRFANALKKTGAKKGDRITIYLPMVPELPIAMLACARIGAIHSVVFGGFSAESLKNRIQDCGSELVITADGGYRGAKLIPLKQTTDDALKECPGVKQVIVLKRTGKEVPFKEGRDRWWHDAVRGQPFECEPEKMDAEDPLFILYTSGSTGKPKGVLHTTGGYLVYTSLTHELIFDLREEDTYWCTADIGWVTGHSYIVYGPLANGATSLMFEGVPQYPDWGRFWDVVDKYQVNTIYTAPTALRALMREGDEPVKKRSRKSLRLLGTVGEPINPEVWLWYHRVVGEGRCPIVDTWWQTETGGILITPLPGAIPQKPGSATLPFFGVEPTVVDDQGKVLEGACSGNLCISRPWPGIMRGVFGDPDRFRKTYFSTFPGRYFTGDGCRRDEDGYYWITGRVDDVINVSGHRLGTAEVESALVSHQAVAEAAVVGFPHEIKGQGIYAYVTLKQGVSPTDSLRADLVQHVRKAIGPLAQPDVIHWAPALPKTRSGKIMRRILRKIAADEFDALGDTSTLADPGVVDTLVKEKKARAGK